MPAFGRPYNPPIPATDIHDGSVSNAEFGCLNGVTSAIQTQIDGKAASSHSHAISDVTGLQTALDGKSGTSHTHTLSQITDAGTAAAKNVPSTGVNATSTQVVMGDDSRLTDARTPASHVHSASDITSGTLSTARLPTGIDAALIGGGVVSNAEFAYLDGVTSAIQTQLNGKEASGAVATHAAVTSGVHGITAFTATLLDDADAATFRATLGLGTAATSASSAFEASGAVSTHAALTSSVHGISAFGATLVDDADAATARGTLGLGTISTQASSSVTITGGSVTGITDLAVADGGTGASSASAARSNLGVAIGSDVQAYDATLAALAAWGWTSGREVPTFTAADTLSILRVGTSANNLIQLDGSAKLPAVDASQLTNLPASGNAVGQSVFSTTTTYNGTSGAFTVEPCTITFPSTGCYRVSVLAPLRILVAATVTAQMACGTCAIGSTNGDVIGTCDNSRAGSIAACTVSTGSPTVISLASRPDIATMAWMAELIIDVTTAGTMKLQFSGAGSTANHFTIVKGAYVRWEKLT